MDSHLQEFANLSEWQNAGFTNRGDLIQIHKKTGELRLVEKYVIIYKGRSTGPSTSFSDKKRYTGIMV